VLGQIFGVSLSSSFQQRPRTKSDGTEWRAFIRRKCPVPRACSPKLFG